jgi:hypothetical protein
MQVTLKQFFNLGDGRLSTNIGDVCIMLNYIFDKQFMTHELPAVLKKLENKNPDWFSNAVSIIDDIKKSNYTNDFEKLMTIIDDGFPNLKIKLKKITY